ncbi:MAG: PIN domain-containing protein [Thermoplasmata archaeon]|nr:MAG: PIN domain-containing protein [Thermoplasmata archaeon]
MYADTDFFLALIKKDDWLKKRAEKLYKKHQNELWTSTLTIKELMLLAYRDNKDVTDIIEKASALMPVKEVDIGVEGHIAASFLIKKYKMTPFDALHAVICDNDSIISSDKKYDLIGLNRITLEKE